jgi:hypothetical protein
MKDITPTRYQCAFGQCPAVYEVDDQIVVIGKNIASAAILNEIESKIGTDETAVIIDRAMLAEVAPKHE